ncbi:hypothetical protein H5410_040261 [Solanum commersonii]|uniref:Uncharacterized protein n=1 Tax=Solanum commersonii TaxID=4109 RepID=A0A9J5XND6_SOLCO|nr:hypothetical protein H5410_040261 [Solanum commersonii]
MGCIYNNIYKVMPAIIMWSLWKRRNSLKHGKSMVNMTLEMARQMVKSQNNCNSFSSRSVSEEKTRATIIHIIREGNCLNDSLANIVIDSQTDHEYHDWQKLPLVGRKNLNSNKSQLPNYMIKTRRITHNDT